MFQPYMPRNGSYYLTIGPLICMIIYAMSEMFNCLSNIKFLHMLVNRYTTPMVSQVISHLSLNMVLSGRMTWVNSLTQVHCGQLLHLKVTFLCDGFKCLFDKEWLLTNLSLINISLKESPSHIWPKYPL